MRMLASITWAVALCMAPYSGADESDSSVHGLTHNPFKSPRLISRPSRESVDSDSVEWTTSLQGTLLSNKPLANMGGTLVSVGDTYKGYTLVSVGEGTATFQNDTHTIVVRVVSEDSNERS